MHLPWARAFISSRASICVTINSLIHCPICNKQLPSKLVNVVLFCKQRIGAYHTAGFCLEILEWWPNYCMVCWTILFVCSIRVYYKCLSKACKKLYWSDLRGWRSDFRGYWPIGPLLTSVGRTCHTVYFVSNEGLIVSNGVLIIGNNKFCFSNAFNWFYGHPQHSLVM